MSIRLDRRKRRFIMENWRIIVAILIGIVLFELIVVGIVIAMSSPHMIEEPEIRIIIPTPGVTPVPATPTPSPTMQPSVQPTQEITPTPLATSTPTSQPVDSHERFVVDLRPTQAPGELTDQELIDRYGTQIPVYQLRHMLRENGQVTPVNKTAEVYVTVQPEALVIGDPCTVKWTVYNKGVRLGETDVRISMYEILTPTEDRLLGYHTVTTDLQLPVSANRNYEYPWRVPSEWDGTPIKAKPYHAIVDLIDPDTGRIICSSNRITLKIARHSPDGHGITYD